MAGDGSDSGSRSTSGRITAGQCVLHVGDPAGITLTLAGKTTDSRSLRRAVSHRASKPARRKRSQRIEAGLRRASDATDTVEHAVTLLNDLLSGRVDASSLGDDAGALVAVLQRLVREEHWSEALRLARVLAALLALIGRWAELVQSLEVALHAARELSDELNEAWALHELGSLHLAAGRHAQADRMLTQARQIRARRGDADAVAVTDRNLQVLCQALRQLLHLRPRQRVLHSLARPPALTLLVSLAILVLAGAGAVVLAQPASSRRPIAVHRAQLALSFAPRVPHAGQSIVFTATASDAQDPVASYTWQWGDGDPAPGRIAQHTYRRAGTYEVTLSVADARHKVLGHLTRTVSVSQPVVEDGPNAYFSFKPSAPTVGERVRFDASASFDPHAPIDRYEWSLGDGHTARGVAVSNAYARLGTYLVTLAIADQQGLRATLTQRVVVSAATAAPTQVFAHCPSQPVALGQAATASGWIAPRRAGAIITVVYESASGVQRSFTAKSDAHGQYSTSFTPPTTGAWSVQSSLAGDARFRASASEACTFAVEGQRHPTSIALECPDKELMLESAATVSGSIKPPRRGAGVQVSYRGPSGGESDQTLTTDENGHFQASNTPTTPGLWRIESSLLGDDEHQPSMSTPCEFRVMEPTKTETTTNTATVKTTTTTTTTTASVGTTTTSTTIEEPQATTLTSMCTPGELHLSETETVSGAIAPTHEGAVTVTFFPPPSKYVPLAPTVDHVTTNNSGKYEATLKPPRTGTWSASASSSASPEYRASTSPACQFTVLEEP